MNDQSSFLFVYGTLQPSFSNPFADYLRQQSHYLGEGTVKGRLIDIGSYPGVFYQPESETVVHGTVVALINQSATVLARLDEYEGVGKNYTQPTEYERVILPVAINGQLINCWAYVYNWPVLDPTFIPSGDYCQYLSQLDR